MAVATTEYSIEASDARGSDAFERLQSLEQTAVRSFLNQPLFVPGLLQVAGYATAMIGGLAGLKPGDPELTERVGVRLRRGEEYGRRLRGSNPPQFIAVIDESVLLRTVGGPDVMRQQIDHLVTVSEWDTVELVITRLRDGAHHGLGGSFEVHEMPDGQAATFIEGAHSDELTGDRGVAQKLRKLVETTASSAAHGKEARELLRTISASL
jgi:hypothetical protein